MPAPEPAEPRSRPSGVEPGLTRQRVVTGWAQLWNLPNMLTILRFALIPFFLYLLMQDDGDNAASRFGATVVFIVAAITDWVDGALARKQGLVTTFGKIADPLADKFLTGAALIGLSVLGELAWWITLVILVREIGVTVVRFVVLKHGVIPASRGGKLKTIFQMVAIIMFLLPIGADQNLLIWIRDATMIVAVALTVLTGADYVDKAYRTRRESKAQQLIARP